MDGPRGAGRYAGFYRYAVRVPGCVQSACCGVACAADVHSAVHTHSPANLAVSAQQHGLLPLTQQAMRFYGRVARYPNEVDDTTREGADQLAAALGTQWVMLLENHGALVCGTMLPDPAVCAARAAKFGRVGIYNSASRDWVAGMALVEKLFPDYKN